MILLILSPLLLYDILNLLEKFKYLWHHRIQNKIESKNSSKSKFITQTANERKKRQNEKLT